MVIYTELGLNLLPADNSVIAGLLGVEDRLSTGRLRVFSTLAEWRDEYRLYRYDEKGQLVKKFDHLMDTTRYLVMSGIQIARTRPAPGSERSLASTGMADSVAGY